MLWNRSWPNLRYYHGICLEGIGKTTKPLSQDGQCLNPGPTEYEVGVLTTRLWHSVVDCWLWLGHTWKEAVLPYFTVSSEFAWREWRKPRTTLTKIWAWHLPNTQVQFVTVTRCSVYSTEWQCDFELWIRKNVRPVTVVACSQLSLAKVVVEWLALTSNTGLPGF
jgi:hypothetical protein